MAMPAVGLLQRNARIHQRQRGAADRRHRGRAVGFGDLRHHADGVGELVLLGQHRMDGAPGELAMADFAAAGRAHAAGFADAVGREVVVQHEGLLAGAFQAVDELLVLGGAQGADAQRLGFAAGEQRRTMGARQDADFRHDGTHRGQVAAVDALLGVQHRVAHHIGFDVMQQAAIDIGGNLAFAFADEFGGELLLHGAERVAALELDREAGTPWPVRPRRPP